MRQRITLALVLFFSALGVASNAVAQDAPGADATPESVFEDLFGEQAAEVARTAAPEDDVQFAKGLLTAVASAKSDPALQRLLCEKAYESAMRSRDGIAVAIKAAEWVVTHQPDEAAPFREKLRDAYQRRYAMSRGDEKLEAGSKLIEMLALDADVAAEAGDFESSAGLLRQAMQMATALRLPMRNDLRELLEAVNRQAITQRRVEQMKASLKQSADAAKATDLIMLYIVELDRPADARKYTFLIEDETLKDHIRDACKSLDDLEPDRVLALGDWYQSLGMQTPGLSRANMLSHAAEYYNAYLESGAGDTLTQTKAKLSLKRTQALIDKLGDTGSRFGRRIAPPAWAKGCVLALSFEQVRTKSGNAFTKDSSRFNHAVRLLGGTMDAGPCGKAIKLDGHDDQVVIAEHDALSIAGDLSIAFWVKVDNLVNRVNPFNKSWGGEGAITIEPSGRVHYFWGVSGGDTGEYQGVLTRAAVEPGKWHHFVAVRDLTNRRIRLYMDGHLTINQPTKFNSSKPSSLPITLGLGYTKKALPGGLDEVAVWSRALSEEEIAKLYEMSSKGTSYCQQVGGR